jgi:hypothetical protein
MKYLLNGESSYNKNNYIEKVLFFYVELMVEDSSTDYIRLLGVDPIVP